jgi:hypothetical protein
MKSAKSDLPRDALVPLILKVVAPGSVRGYAITQRLKHV